MNVYALWKRYFFLLDQLQLIILNSYIQTSNLETYTNKIHFLRLKLFTLMQKIRLSEPKELITLSEHIYELIFSLTTLKFRLPDQATFEICAIEFKNLAQAINYFLDFIKKNLSQRSQKNPAVMSEAAKRARDLTHAIENFEETYRSTLQVVSAEPILFLFFIQDLMALRDALEKFFLRLINA